VEQDADYHDCKLRDSSDMCIACAPMCVNPSANQFVDWLADIPHFRPNRRSLTRRTHRDARLQLRLYISC
jgi:hypothetical protein